MQYQNKIDVFIGTKAQYIKTAPLLRLFDKESMNYWLIDSGQHADFSPKLRRELGVQEPNAILPSKGNIKSVFEAGKWFFLNLMLTIFRPGKLKREIFSEGPGYCIIHGDTPTTLLSLLMAKRVGKKVVHLEAGLRSYNILRPFPEELIRIICMKFADVLFAPSDWAEKNLIKMNLKAEIINMGQNTNVEALYFSLGKATPPVDISIPYCLFTVHRVETILKKSRLEFILDIVAKVRQSRRIVFVMHDPTAKKLRDFNLLQRLKEYDNVELLNLVPHNEFLILLENADFVLTDGGSIQEESFYLDVPCLILRTETERDEGLGANAKICGFDKEIVSSFLNNYSDYTMGAKVENCEPSRIVLEYFQRRSSTERKIDS